MKNTVAKIFFLIIASFFIAGCEFDDFVKDYDFTALYFAKDKIGRSIIIGEYDFIQVGVVLSGKVTNEEEEWVKYHLNSDTATASGYTVLPESYYTIENSVEGKDANTFFVASGEFLGLVKVTLNDQFVSDPLALDDNYALGFELENEMSVDSILEGREVVIITFKYISTAEGNYYHTGTAGSTVYDEGVWKLTTTGPTTLETNGLGGKTGSNNKFTIDLNPDNTVSLSSASGGVAITDQGGSKYDPELRQLYLNYSYTDGGTSYSSKDTLVIRNRVVDGINQVNF